MINLKIIYKIIGTLLILEVLLLLLCLGVGVFFGETDYAAFGVPAAVTFVAAMFLKYLGKNAEPQMGRRDGYLIVSLTWIIFSFVGMFPFLLGGYETRVAAAFFESMSGFTTTGASVLNNIDSLPHSILFWRSLMHWFGGMGIVFFTIAVLPQMGAGDLKLFSAETTGLKTSKMLPRIRTTARWLWTIYVMLTLACMVCLYVGGMGLFDAINHGLATISTGGFSTHQDSIAYYNSPLLEYIIATFMFLGGINFTLLYLFFIKRRWYDVFHDCELRCFAALVVTVTLCCTASLYFGQDYPLEEAFRKALFHTISLETTTGYTTCDPMAWPSFTWYLLLMVSMIGASAGSTSGGTKCIRILTAYKLLINEFKHILHPRAVLPVRLNHVSLNSTVGQTIFAFLVAYIVLIFGGAMFMTSLGLPMLDSFSSCISSFSNVGPSMGWVVGPTTSWSVFPDSALWVQSFLMLAGRLEIFSLLLPFVPSFWKDM